MTTDTGSSKYHTGQSWSSTFSEAIVSYNSVSETFLQFVSCTHTHINIHTGTQGGPKK